MNSKVWGQFLWRLLHTITYSYNNKCPQQLKTKYIEVFYSLRNLIPCVICRNHYRQRLQKMPVERYMDNRDNLIDWLIKLHNEVNIGLHKRFVSRAEADRIYVDSKNNLKYDFKDFVILFRLFSMMNEINCLEIQKFIKLVFDIYPNQYLTKNCPKSQKNIKKILIPSDLNKWIVEFDAELSKNTNRKPHIIVTNRQNQPPPPKKNPVVNNNVKKDPKKKNINFNGGKLDGYENNGIPSISNSKLIDKVSDTSVDYDLMKGFLKKYSLI